LQQLPGWAGEEEEEEVDEAGEEGVKGEAEDDDEGEYIPRREATAVDKRLQRLNRARYGNDQEIGGKSQSAS
jgi:hypothetical protein